MSRHHTLLCLLCLLCLLYLAPLTLQGQSPKIEDIGRLPESFEMALDTLLNNRYKEYYTLHQGKRHTTPDSTKDSLYMMRVYKMESAIPLPYNSIISEAIDLYVHKRSSLIGQMLARSTYYFPMFEEVLDKHGLPLELKYLAIVESALNPQARSRAGATGIWQFMLRTAKTYGLQVDSMVDERMDPRKSTEAMAQYFKDMYQLYGDWMLAIAAYNCGPGNVNKAIRRSGSTEFWELYPYLPRETRSYVPFFIAAFYAMEHYREHNIRPYTVTLPLATDTIHIHTKQSFATISNLTQVSEELLEQLNPKYRRKIVPGNQKPQVVILPTQNATYFAMNRDSLMAMAPVDLALAGKVSSSSEEGTQEAKQVSQRYYTVRRGDTLSGIASKHRGATVNKIKRANGLKSSRIQPGQCLIIPY